MACFNWSSRQVDDDCSHIARIRINDVVFTVGGAAAATAAAKGRAGEVRGHDEGCAAVDDHTFLVRQREARAGILRLHTGRFQLVDGARGRATTKGVRLKHEAHVYATVGILFKSPYHVAVRQEVDLQPDGFLRRADGVSDDMLTRVWFNEDVHVARS